MHLHWNTNIHSVDSNFMKAQIGQLNLDILMYGEIGMESTSYFLAFSRLARRSVVFWGHAVTSGIVDDFATFSAHRGINISLSTFRRFFAGGPDYFVSSVLFEDSRNGGRHCSQLRYVERLILMQVRLRLQYIPQCTR